VYLAWCNDEGEGDVIKKWRLRSIGRKVGDKGQKEKRGRRGEV